MKCADCQRELEPGDRYIADTASGYLGEKGSDAVDSMVAMIMGGDEATGRIIYCESCTAPGGDYVVETYYGEDLD